MYIIKTNILYHFGTLQNKTKKIGTMKQNDNIWYTSIYSFCSFKKNRIQMFVH